MNNNYWPCKRMKNSNMLYFAMSHCLQLVALQANEEQQYVVLCYVTLLTIIGYASEWRTTICCSLLYHPVNNHWHYKRMKNSNMLYFAMSPCYQLVALQANEEQQYVILCYVTLLPISGPASEWRTAIYCTLLCHLVNN